jgi:transposase-like protein
MSKDNSNHNTLTDLDAFKAQILEHIKAGKPLNGKNGVLTPLIKEVMNAALEGEMEAHLDSEAQSEVANRRNGKTSKVVKSASGEFELITPRDRNGSFEPQLVKKRQTILTDELDDKILGLFAIGTSYKDIAANLSEMYGVELSTATISSVTDKLLPLVTQWRNRPLESIYPIIFLDAMFFKARENGKVVTKAVYNILGINQEGIKDILGFYVAESEGANFWLGVLSDLQARGIKDILIASIDGLKGFPEAIQSIFPKTEIQLCIVHQIRNSIKYVVSKEQKPFMIDLKKVYQADTKELAEFHFLELEEKWGKRYPSVIKSWSNNWDNLTNYFKYTKDIRKIVYTTNPIEGFHRQVRKYTKTKGAFTSEGALFKLIYCACDKIKERWNQPLHNWALTIGQLDLHFEGRLNLALR